MNINLQPLIETIPFHDIDELAERMGAFRWDMVHRPIEMGTFEGELFVAQVGDIQLARTIYNRGIRSQGDFPPGTITVGIPLSTPRVFKWHGYSLSSNSALLQKSSRGIDMLRSGNLPLALVTIDMDSLFSLAEKTDRPQAASLITDSTLAIQPASTVLRRFRSHLRSIFELFWRQPQTILQPNLQSLIREDFISLVLDVLDSHQNTPPLHPSRRHPYIKRAEEILLDNLDRPLSILDLCLELHISERTLRYGFQECFGLGPAAYLKIQRLNGVRRQLKASAGREITISAIALQWGFWHMGQFAKDYKEMFGECPSETLRCSSSSKA
jgi:AraC family ethanolamine operon transcriptional activator